MDIASMFRPIPLVNSAPSLDRYPLEVEVALSGQKKFEKGKAKVPLSNTRREVMRLHEGKENFLCGASFHELGLSIEGRRPEFKGQVGKARWTIPVELDVRFESWLTVKFQTPHPLNPNDRTENLISRQALSSHDLDLAMHSVSLRHNVNARPREKSMSPIPCIVDYFYGEFARCTAVLHGAKLPIDLPRDVLKQAGLSQEHQHFDWNLVENRQEIRPEDITVRAPELSDEEYQELLELGEQHDQTNWDEVRKSLEAE